MLDTEASRFETASAEEIPPYNWIPPKWEENCDEPPTLTHTTNEPFPLDPKFGTTEAEAAKVVANFVNDWEGRRAEKDPGAPPKSNLWPSPFSDFSHVDPVESADENGAEVQFDGKELETLKLLLNTGVLHQEDKKRERLGQLSSYLTQLEKVIGPNSDGMQRLGHVFEWVLWKATVLLNEVDKKLTADKGTPQQRREEYMAARANYISFIKDMDDREPETKLRKMEHNGNELPVEAGKRGYGRAVKWAYIDPVIVNGRIKQARVIAQWNPHSSSSGIPVTH